MLAGLAGRAERDGRGSRGDLGGAEPADEDANEAGGGSGILITGVFQDSLRSLQGKRISEIAAAITIYFWWRNTQGLHESSEDALRIIFTALKSHNKATAYWPGDAYVDFQSIDGYNWGASQSWSSWRSPEEVFAPMLARLRAFLLKDPATTETCTRASVRRAGIPVGPRPTPAGILGRTMTSSPYLDAVRDRVVIFDGAAGCFAGGQHLFLQPPGFG